MSELIFLLTNRACYLEYECNHLMKDGRKALGQTKETLGDGDKTDLPKSGNKTTSQTSQTQTSSAGNPERPIPENTSPASNVISARDLRFLYRSAGCAWVAGFLAMALA